MSVKVETRKKATRKFRFYTFNAPGDEIELGIVEADDISDAVSMMGEELGYPLEITDAEEEKGIWYLSDGINVEELDPETDEPLWLRKLDKKKGGQKATY